MLLRTLFVISFCVLAALATAQEVTIKRVLKVGEATRYRVSVELTIGEAKASVSGLTTLKAVKVNADGSYEIESTHSEGKAEMEGAVYPQQEPPMTTSHNAYGDIVSLKGEKVDSSVYRMHNISAFRTPDKAVNVGESWVRELPANPKTGAVAAKATYRFEATETVGGVKALKLKYTYAESGPAVPATAEGYMWINPDDASVLKSEITITNAPLPLRDRVNAKIVATRE
jgi:hypothetical protein